MDRIDELSNANWNAEVALMSPSFGKQKGRPSPDASFLLPKERVA